MDYKSSSEKFIVINEYIKKQAKGFPGGSVERIFLPMQNYLGFAP